MSALRLAKELENLGFAPADAAKIAGGMAIASGSSPVIEQAVGKMMHAFVPISHYWILSTQVIDGWASPFFTTLDGLGSYIYAPFTGAPISGQTAPALNVWQQNTTGQALYLNVMAAIIGEIGQNGHMYLVTSPDMASLVRQDFLALRTGAAGQS